MDLNTITSFRRATTRDELVLSPGEVILGGGTWLFGEPQPEASGLVDVTAMGWPDLEISARGLRIAATCTIAELVAFAEGRASDVAAPSDWSATALFPVAANALLASFKIWNTATVGGNVCRSYSAGAMVSLSAALDGEAVIWSPDGTERRTPVAALMTGNGTNDLAPGEVLRAVDLPTGALRSRARLRKIALAEHGRSGAVVTGRVDQGGASVFSVTAATLTPTVLRYPGLPAADELARDIAETPDFYTDPLGSADWRRAVSIVLGEQIRDELAASDAGSPS